MDNKQILNREDSINKSVVLNNEELVDKFMGYFGGADRSAISEALKRARDKRYIKAVDKLILSGEEVNTQSIKATTTIPDGAPVWRYYGDSKAEALDIMLDALEERAKDFVESRFPLFWTTFLKYLEPMVLAGMRGGWLIGTWWRAVNYGFSVEPHSEDESAVYTPNGFPYTTVEQMTEDDYRAFRWTVEDVFYNIVEKPCFIPIQERIEALNGGEWKDEFTEDVVITYPREGYTIEELLEADRMVSKFAKDEPITKEKITDTWLFEIDLFYPIVISRLAEALYYATKFSGSEYKDYIENLNVEEDYNLPSKEKGEGEKYDIVMKEGYVWHWGE